MPVTLSKMKSGLVMILVIGLFAASCGSVDQDGYDVADRVLAAVDQPVGPTSSDSTGRGSTVGDSAAPGSADPHATEGVEALASTDECTTVEVEDEYGFINLVSTCDTEGGSGVTLADREPGPIDPAEVLAAAGYLPLWVQGELLAAGPEPVEARLSPLVTAIEAMEAVCGIDFDRWLGELSVVVIRAEELAAGIEVGQLGEYVTTETAKAMSRSLMERSLLLTGCAEPEGGAPIPLRELTDRGALDLTARATATLTKLGQLLDGDLSNYLFHFFSTGPNYHWLRTQPRALDLVVYGTSQAGAGVEVPLLGQELSLLVGNAFLPGSLAEVQQHWFPEVERFVDPATVVWLIGPIDLLIGCESPGREQQFVDRVTRRQRAFRVAGWFSGIEPTDLLLGPATEENINRGNAAKKPAPDEAAIVAHLDDYQGQLSAPGYCVERADVIGRSIARMIGDGRQVVVVGMPISPLGYAHLPGGPETASEALRRMDQEQFAGLGVEVVDLSAAIQDPELWADYTHLTQSGAEAFTRLMAAEIEGLIR